MLHACMSTLVHMIITDFSVSTCACVSTLVHMFITDFLPHLCLLLGPAADCGVSPGAVRASPPLSLLFRLPGRR